MGTGFGEAEREAHSSFLCNRRGRHAPRGRAREQHRCSVPPSPHIRSMPPAPFRCSIKGVLRLNFPQTIYNPACFFPQVVLQLLSVLPALLSVALVHPPTPAPHSTPLPEDKMTALRHAMLFGLAARPHGRYGEVPTGASIAASGRILACFANTSGTMLFMQFGILSTPPSVYTLECAQELKCRVKNKQTSSSLAHHRFPSLRSMCLSKTPTKAFFRTANVKQPGAGKTRGSAGELLTSVFAVFPTGVCAAGQGNRKLLDNSNFASNLLGNFPFNTGNTDSSNQNLKSISNPQAGFLNSNTMPTNFPTGVWDPNSADLKPFHPKCASSVEQPERS